MSNRVRVMGVMLVLSAGALLIPVDLAFADLDDLETEETEAEEPPAKPSAKPKDEITPDLNDQQQKPTSPPKAVPPADSKQKAPAPEVSKPPAKATNKPVKQASKDSDKKEPVKFTSKGLVATRDKGVVELEEDVKVTQGNLKLTSDKAKIFFIEEINDVDKVFCTGNVRVIKDSEDPLERIRASGSEAVFHNKERKVVLRGDARLWRAGDLVRGREITYRLDTGWITVDRVEGVMQPSEKKPAVTEKPGSGADKAAAGAKTP